jgi:hypothetical protein
MSNAGNIDTVYSKRSFLDQARDGAASYSSCPAIPSRGHGISRLREEMEEGEAQRGFAKAAVEAPAQLYVSVSVSVQFS